MGRVICRHRQIMVELGPTADLPTLGPVVFVHPVLTPHFSPTRSASVGGWRSEKLDSYSLP